MCCRSFAIFVDGYTHWSPRPFVQAPRANIPENIVKLTLPPIEKCMLDAQDYADYAEMLASPRGKAAFGRHSLAAESTADVNDVIDSILVDTDDTYNCRRYYKTRRNLNPDLVVIG